MSYTSTNDEAGNTNFTGSTGLCFVRTVSYSIYGRIRLLGITSHYSPSPKEALYHRALVGTLVTRTIIRYSLRKYVTDTFQHLEEFVHVFAAKVL
jgi:hypothetical protein